MLLSCGGYGDNRTTGGKIYFGFLRSFHSCLAQTLWPVVRQSITAERAQWSREAHFTVARKRRDREGLAQHRLQHGLASVFFTVYLASLPRELTSKGSLACKG